MAAVFLWLGIGLYVFAAIETASFVSWQSLVYFVGGTLIAALIFGLPAYFFQENVLRLLFPEAARSGDSSSLSVKAIGILVLIGQAVVIYVAVHWMVRDLLFAPR